MISVPALKTVCGEGHGMAACPVLRLLVTSSYNDLTVFALPDSIVEKAGTSDGLTRIRTIGGGGSAEPMDFKFMEDNGCISGWMAFTGSTAASRLLLVTDAGNNAVHVIDVLHGAHVGYLAAPGSICKPLGVAAWGTKVAVSAFVRGFSHVQLYEGSGASWTIGRMIGSMYPSGLRFTADGKELAFAHDYDGRLACVSLFRVIDGTLVRHLDTGLAHIPSDVEECADYGWAVADWAGKRIRFVGGASDQSCLGKTGHRDGEFKFPSALAFVPGLGLVVRERDNGGRVQFFATPDVVAMASMSAIRTSWMMTVALAITKKERQTMGYR
jgi:hypothetical protein